jgi:Domain of unknown function (DUF5666)
MKTITRILLLTTALLTSCGSSDPGVGSGGTGAANTNGTANGIITGFGSVIVEGVRYDDSTASFKIDQDPLSLRNATSNELRLGMQTEVQYQIASVQGSSEKGANVTVGAEIIGPLDSAPIALETGNVQLSVAGQSVLVIATGAFATVLDGINTASSLKTSDRIEVHGHRDLNERVIATRIELLEIDAPMVTRVLGRISARTSDTLWRVNGLTVQLEPSTRSSPSPFTATVGDQVAVYATSNTTGGLNPSLKATAVRRVSVARVENDGWRVGGVVRSIDRANQRLSIGYFEIDISATTLSAATIASLVVGDVVRVQGSAIGNRVKASTIEVLRATSSNTVEITGVLSSFVPGSQGRIREAVLNLSGAISYSNGGAERLADGVLLKVTGNLQQGQLSVQSIEFLDTEDIRTTAVAGKVGTVNNANSTNLTFTLGQVLVKPTANARYLFQNGSAASASQLQLNVEVVASGVFINGQFFATEVVFQDNQSAPRARTRGIVSSIDTIARRLVIDGVSVTWSNTTEISGTLNASALGRYGEAEGVLMNGVIVATKVKAGR